MNTHQVGAAGEELAAEELARMGYHILERNFRCRQGEIDLIAQDGEYLVFVEVRSRKDTGKGHPLETVTPAKCRRICRVSLVYCFRHRLPEETPIRYDVVSVLDGKIEVVKNAFPYQGT